MSKAPIPPRTNRHDRQSEPLGNRGSPRSEKKSIGFACPANQEALSGTAAGSLRGELPLASAHSWPAWESRFTDSERASLHVAPRSAGKNLPNSLQSSSCSVSPSAASASTERAVSKSSAITENVTSTASSRHQSAPSTRRGRRPTSWTPEEDARLAELVEAESRAPPSMAASKTWSIIASKLTSRTGKQCRERWLNQLKPGIKREPWTPEEERILYEAHAQLGNKWVAIAECLPGRTDNCIKNHYNSMLRKQQRRMQAAAAAEAAESKEAVRHLKPWPYPSYHSRSSSKHTGTPFSYPTTPSTTKSCSSGSGSVASQESVAPAPPAQSYRNAKLDISHITSSGRWTRPSGIDQPVATAPSTQSDCARKYTDHQWPAVDRRALRAPLPTARILEELQELPPRKAPLRTTTGFAAAGVPGTRLAQDARTLAPMRGQGQGPESTVHGQDYGEMQNLQSADVEVRGEAGYGVKAPVRSHVEDATSQSSKGEHLVFSGANGPSSEDNNTESERVSAEKCGTSRPAELARFQGDDISQERRLEPVCVPSGNALHSRSSVASGRVRKAKPSSATGALAALAMAASAVPPSPVTPDNGQRQGRRLSFEATSTAALPSSTARSPMACQDVSPTNQRHFPSPIRGSKDSRVRDRYYP